MRIRRGILALAALLLAPFIFVMTFVVGLQDFKNHMDEFDAKHGLNKSQ